MKALPVLLTVFLTGATTTTINTLARDRTMPQPISPEAGLAPGTDKLRSLARATEWLNSPPLTEAGLRGKVVLVQFGTYTCINWLRTLPYVRAWAGKYRDQGLVVIVVHAPEFGFEKNLDNVRRATQAIGVRLPVAVDNKHEIWRAFDNNYWPALYLVDADGRLRHHHFGEGAYQESERMIQRLLAESGHAGAAAGLVTVDGRGVEAPADWDNLKSPENYLGAERTDGFASPGEVGLDQARVYAAPARLGLNQWALAGEWTVGGQAIASGKARGRIVYRFHARDLHLVMGPVRHGASLRFRVLLDGKPPGAAHGGDIDEQGYGTVIEQRMYQLIRQPGPIEGRLFEIEFLDAGAEAFAFTFG